MRAAIYRWWILLFHLLPVSVFGVRIKGNTLNFQQRGSCVATAWLQLSGLSVWMCRSRLKYLNNHFTELLWKYVCAVIQTSLRINHFLEEKEDPFIWSGITLMIFGVLLWYFPLSITLKLLLNSPKKAFSLSCARRNYRNSLRSGGWVVAWVQPRWNETWLLGLSC